MARSRRKSKTPPGKGAFTLVELLIVIVILGLLLALLFPSLRGVWKRYNMTRCQTNLAHIYQAFRLRAADEAMGVAQAYKVAMWTAVLPPYLENDASQFKCPEALEGQIGDAAPSRPLTDLAEFKTGSRITTLDAGPYMLKLSDTQYNKARGLGFLSSDHALGLDLKTTYPEFATFVPDNTPDVYWLLLEDGGAWDYDDVVTTVTINSDGTITLECVAGWTGGTSYLMDKLTGEVLATCKGLPVPYKGPFVLGVAGVSASSSYGMNEYALDKVAGGHFISGVGGAGGKILVLDYPRLEAKTTDIWTDKFFDPSKSGVPSFARHFGMANILFSDGSVRAERVDTKDPPPENINPIAPTTAMKWWMP
jgi:prepilin-type N-terminal cleavage/methylation domain-containing protein/prepilin-type processing-associated H-X9-DG protein